MNLFLLVITCLIAVPDRPMPKLPPMAKSVYESLIGEWQVVGVSIGGGQPDRPDGKQTMLTFTPTLIQVTHEAKRAEHDDATYSLDVSKNPIAIDLVRTADEKVMPSMSGSIKLEGDRLTMCFAVGRGAARPTTFVATPDVNQMVMVLRRIQRK